MALSIKQQWEIEQKTALNLLLDWAGDAATLAKLAQVSPQVVNGWIKRGRVSATAACTLDRLVDCPLPKETIRPDVMEWNCNDR